MIYRFERTIRTSTIIRTTSTLSFLASSYHSDTAITKHASQLPRSRMFLCICTTTRPIFRHFHLALSLSLSHLSVSIRILLTWLALLRHITHLRIVTSHLGHHPITSWLGLHTSWLRLHTRSTVISYSSAL